MTEISTRDRAGEYDALETAKPDEPLFVVQGGDPFGPATVMFWAGLQREAAMQSASRDDAQAGLRKASNAEEVAWEMREYQRGDAPAATAESKRGRAVEVARDADRDRIAATSLFCDEVYNAIAQLSDVADGLAKLGGHAAAEMKLRDAVIAAGEAVQMVEPRRHLQRADAPAQVSA